MRDVIDRSPHDDQADLEQEIAEIRRHLDHDRDWTRKSGRGMSGGSTTSNIQTGIG
jgi:hypothetical protein